MVKVVNNSRRLRSIIAGRSAAALLWLALSGVGARAQVASEYDVKAAFLYNFAKFVRWPGEHFPPVTQSFRLCLLGDDPFGGVLENAVVGKSIQERSLTVQHLDDPQEAAACQMVFVSRSELQRLRQITAILDGAPVLIVGDSPDAVYTGGMIGFHMVGNRVRFMINQDAVTRAGLEVSSQLLNVADKVIAGGERP